MSTEPDVKAPAAVGRSSNFNSSGLEIAITGLTSVRTVVVVVSEALDLIIGAKNESRVKPKTKEAEKITMLETTLRWF